jgi:hypothetical protein
MISTIMQSFDLFGRAARMIKIIRIIRPAMRGIKYQRRCLRVGVGRRNGKALRYFAHNALIYIANAAGVNYSLF